jgi:hypothetical protein
MSHGSTSLQGPDPAATTIRGLTPVMAITGVGPA